MDRSLPWETVFEELPVPVSVVDLDGRPLAGNRAYRDLFGVVDGRFVDLSATQLTAPEDRARTQAYFLQLRSGAATDVVLDKRYVRTDGSSFTGELHAHRLGGAGGSVDASIPDAVIGVIVDVTDAREASAALAGARDTAERASAAKSAFVARVSHDLRTPLHALIGYTELLEKLVAGQAAQQLAELIHKQAGSLQHLIDDLLDLSAIESGRLELHRAPADLRATITETIQAVRMAHDTGGLVLRAAVADDVPPGVTTDDRRVREVLTNLIGNAVKYTPAGSVDVVATLDGDLVRIEVSDTGPGIDPAYLGTLFDPFRKAGTRLARSEQTTGLGLAIVKQLVELLGGTVGVDSEPGLGSTFWFTLPLATDDTDASPATPTAPGARAARIMVVDDSPTNLELIEQQLRSIGHEPVTVGDARTAIARLDDTIDIVLMDVNMPDVDGLEATRWIRAAGWRTPVVALTAAAMAADRAACTRAGMDGFLTKPIGLSGLADAVRQWVTPERDAPAPSVRSVGPEGPLDDLVREAGTTAAMAVVRSFLRESERRVGELYEAARTGDDDAFVRQAHTLASTSQLVGGAEVARLCSRAERAGLADTDVDALHAQLEDAYARLRTTLIAALADLEGSTP